MIVRLAHDMPGALQHLARAIPHDVHDSGCTVHELAAGQAVFELVQDDGRQVGALAVSVHDYSAGRVIRCGAAGGEPGHDLAGTMSAFLAHEAKRIGARSVTFETRRRGLVRRLAREGFRVSGFVLSRVTQ